MKARLTFDLSDKDDAMAHRRCTHSAGMALVIWDIIHKGHKCENIAEMYDYIAERCERYGIVIDDLIE